MESAVLERLRGEIDMDEIQFGGVRGAGVEHLLIEIWERILGGLEVPEVAVTLLGVDYEKAFNRMSHNECLRQLAILGASQASLDLVASFLYSRKMQARVGGQLSKQYNISSGSPQGSILGCYLYCITTQQLGKDLLDRGVYEETQAVHPSQGPPVEYGPAATSTPGQQHTRDAMLVPSTSSDSWDTGSGTEWLTAEEDFLLGSGPIFMTGRNRRILDSSSSSDQEVSGSAAEEAFTTVREENVDVFDFLVDIFKYVDDTTIVEAVDISGAIKHFTTAASRAMSKAKYTEVISNLLTDKASQIGMKVNCKKTQLLMVSAPNGFKNESYIRIGQEQIKSEDRMKLLGFVFGPEPNVRLHVEEIKSKFRARFWSLIHLRKSGFKGVELLKLFNVFVRPTIEYCSVVYHSLLTEGQSNELERMQKQAVKLAFGWEKSYQMLCAENQIETLRERRENYVNNFIKKTVASEWFGPLWYPLRDPTTHNLRDRRPFYETKARSTRYFNSPLAFLRIRANELAEDPN